MALCRLLERQGILKGDLNFVQQLALQAAISFETKDLVEIESYKIKTQIAIANPQIAKTIFEEKDSEEFYDYEEVEKLDVDDPNASYSDETVDEMLSALKDFGFYVEDM